VTKKRLCRSLLLTVMGVLWYT